MDTNVGKRRHRENLSLIRCGPTLACVVPKLKGLVRFMYTKTNLYLKRIVDDVVGEGYERAPRFFPGYEVHPCQ